MSTRNYSPSTIEVIGDMKNGLMVETSVLANLTYLHQDQWEIFNVYGRIIVWQLFLEAITQASANATTVQFNFTSTVPVIAVQPMCTASASISGLAQGLRVVWVGGAVATAAVITATAGISDVICTSPHIIGTREGVGTIGFVTAGADQASGTSRFAILYTPLDAGSYVTANL